MGVASERAERLVATLIDEGLLVADGDRLRLA